MPLKFQSSRRGSRQGEGKVSGLALPPRCEGDFTLLAMPCHSATPWRSLGPVDILSRLLDVRLIREAPATLTHSARPAAAAAALTGDAADNDGGRGLVFSGRSREGTPGISVHVSFRFDFLQALNEVSLTLNRLFTGTVWLPGQQCHRSVTFSLGGRA